MIAWVAVGFITLGLLLFAVGFGLNRPEIAMFGALIVIGIGATAMTSGVEIKVGENTTIVNDSGTNITVTEDVHENINVHSGFPLDIIIMLLGVVMLIGSAGAASEADMNEPDDRRPPWDKE